MGAEFAERFRTQIISDHISDMAELVNTCGIETQAPILIDKHTTYHKFLDLILSLFEEHNYQSSGICEDMLNDESQDVIDLYRTIYEFQLTAPNVTIIHMLPLDLSGSFAFIVEDKHS